MLNSVNINLSSAAITKANSLASVVRDSILQTGKLTALDFYFGTPTDDFLGTQLTFQVNNAATLEITRTIYNASAEHFFITQGTGKVWVKPTAVSSSVWITDSLANPVSQIDIAGIATSKLVGLSTFKPLTVNGLWNGTSANPATLAQSVNRVWTITRTTGDLTNLTMQLHWDAADQGGGVTNAANMYLSTGTTWGASGLPITTDSVAHTFDINARPLKSGSYGISMGTIAMNDDSSMRIDDDLEKLFFDAILGTKENLVEQQQVAEAQERSAMENMFSQMANRGSLMERNSLFKTDIDIGLEELLAV